MVEKPRPLQPPRPDPRTTRGNAPHPTRIPGGKRTPPRPARPPRKPLARTPIRFPPRRKTPAPPANRAGLQRAHRRDQQRDQRLHAPLRPRATPLSPRGKTPRPRVPPLPRGAPRLRPAQLPHRPATPLENDQDERHRGRIPANLRPPAKLRRTL